MKDELSTKAEVFETGEKDVFGVAYKGNRLLSCHNNKLTEYTVADGTEIICDRAFYDCKALERIVLPDSVKAIGEAAFSGCRNLREVNIHEGITVIKQGTFRDCDSLAELTLPKSVVALEKFSMGNGLTTLTCLAAEMDINKSAFGHCDKLATLCVHNGSETNYRKYLQQCGSDAIVEPISELEISKMKAIAIEICGIEKMLDGETAEGDIIDARSWFVADDNLKFIIDGKEYNASQFQNAEDLENKEILDLGSDVDAGDYFKSQNAKIGILHTNKSSATLVIEIPENEEFDLHKSAIITNDLDYSFFDYDTILTGFVYNGTQYWPAPENSDGVSSKEIWEAYVPDETDEDDDYDEDYDDDVNENCQDSNDDESSVKNILVDIAFYSIPFPSSEETFISNIPSSYSQYVICFKDDKCVGLDIRCRDAVKKYDFIEEMSDADNIFVDNSCNCYHPSNPDFQDEYYDDPLRFALSRIYGIETDVEWEWSSNMNILLKISFDGDSSFYEVESNGSSRKLNMSDEEFDNQLMAIHTKRAENNNGLALIRIHDKMGAVNSDGEFIIPLIYDEIIRFRNGFARVRVGHKHGFVSENGTVVAEPVFESVWDFDNGKAKVKLDGKIGFINTEGAYMLEPIYDNISAFSAQSSGGWFDDDDDDAPSIAKYELNGLFGYFDEKFAPITQNIFEDGGGFHEGFAKVKKNGKWGFIGTDGEYLIEPIFDGAGDFSDGFASVKLGEKSGYIKKDGQYLVEPMFDSVCEFYGGEATVYLGDKKGTLHKTGEVTWNN